METRLAKSGIYGANIPWWDDSLFELVGEGRFKWAVVRTDTSPVMAQRLFYQGLDVVMQFPDTFNRWALPSPGEAARAMLNTLRPFTPFSKIVCLDNEPNLEIDRSSNWYAEEFTRWYRALVAAFRYYDRLCHWQPVFPAIIGHPQRNYDYWLGVNKENILESEYVAVHCYWDRAWHMTEYEHGGLYLRYHGWYPEKKLLILEYNSCKPDVTEAELCQQLPQYLVGLPDYVLCACYFILGGTPEWNKFWLTPAVAKALGGV